jgi:hypothetical protein
MIKDTITLGASPPETQHLQWFLQIVATRMIRELIPCRTNQEMSFPMDVGIRHEDRLVLAKETKFHMQRHS